MAFKQNIWNKVIKTRWDSNKTYENKGIKTRRHSNKTYEIKELKPDGIQTKHMK